MIRPASSTSRLADRPGGRDTHTGADQVGIPSLFGDDNWDAHEGEVVALVDEGEGEVEQQQDSPCPRQKDPSQTSRARKVRIGKQPFRGRYIRAVPCQGNLRDLAWDAMLRAGAFNRAESGPSLNQLLKKERLVRPGRLLLFVVDISGSMGGRQMALAKRVAARVLETAYVMRDRIAMIAFRDKSAELLFGPGNQLRHAQQLISNLAVGGTTPLASALGLAGTVLQRSRQRAEELDAILVLISDGRANVGRAADLHGEVEQLAGELSRYPGLTNFVLDTTASGDHGVPARRLSRWLRATRLPVAALADRGIDPADAISEHLKHHNRGLSTLHQR